MDDWIAGEGTLVDDLMGAIEEEVMRAIEPTLERLEALQLQLGGGFSTAGCRLADEIERLRGLPDELIGTIASAFIGVDVAPGIGHLKPV
jgi:hypothetical protein